MVDYEKEEAAAPEEGRLTELTTSFIGTTFENTLLKRKVERTFEVTRGRGRRHKQLLNDLKEKRRYWQLKEER